jgi:hypothetical protein
MSIWTWVAVGGVALLVLPVVVALAVARILDGIAEELSKALDRELWSSAPMMRELDEAADTFSERPRLRLPQRSET